MESLGKVERIVMHHVPGVTSR